MSRIVIQSPDPQRLAALQRSLSTAGLTVLGGVDLPAVLEHAPGAGVALVVVDDTVDEGSALKAVLERRGASAVPLVLLARQVAPGDLAGFFRGGVVDVLEHPMTAEMFVARVRHQLDEAARYAGQAHTPEARVLHRLVAFVQATARSATLTAACVHGPVELVFRRGQLLQARVGSMTGAEAARALVLLPAVEDVVLVPGEATPAPPVPAPVVMAPAPVPTAAGAVPAPVDAVAVHPATLPPTSAQQVMGKTPPVHRPPAMQVLVVDDDSALLDIACRFLERAGFAIQRAGNGTQAMEMARAAPPQVVVSDIMMPEVDGWSLLRQFREDHRLREIPFLMLSCHDEFMDRLRQVGAGADAYMAKGVRGDTLVKTVVAAAERHREVWLLAGDGVRLEGRLERVGAINLLRALAFHGCTGTLHMRDTWGEVWLGLKDGRLCHAAGHLPPVTQDGRDALRTYVCATGGRFVFDPRTPPPEGPAQDVDAAVAAACEEANAHERQVREALMVQGAGLAVQAPLLKLYESVTTGVPPSVLEALARGMSPAEVMVETGESPLLVEWVVQDMVRKGVATFAPAAAPA